MKRWSALLLVLALVLGACGNKNKRPDQELVTEKDPVRGFLSFIPSDTPYAFVAAEPMPLGPWLQWARSYDDDMRQLLKGYEDVLRDEYVDSETKLVLAILDEFAGKFTPDGLRSLGLSTSPRLAIYGIGFLPAMRLDLADSEAFAAFLGRVEQKAGLSRRVETVGDSEFWTYPAGDDVVVMAVANRQLAIGFTPVESSELFTRHLVGEQLPDTTLADVDTLQEIIDAHGFQEYGAGFIDLERIAGVLLRPRDGLNDQIARLAFANALPSASTTCVEETMEIIARAPRVVFGYEDWSTEGARFGMALELESDVGTQLKAAKAPTPAVGSDFANRSPAYLAFGFHVGAVAELIQTKATLIRDDPYVCEWYRDVNRAASEIARYAPTLPPMVTSLQGGAVVLTGLRRDQPPQTRPSNPTFPSQPINRWKVEGLAMVVSANPVSLWDFGRSFVPEYLSLNVRPDGKPVGLPPSQQTEFLDTPHVILTDRALGITSGDSVVEPGADLVSEAGSNAGPFAVLAYDLGEVAKALGDGAGDALIRSFGLDGFGGRTEFTLEPRDESMFLHVDVEFAKPSPP